MKGPMVESTIATIRWIAKSWSIASVGFALLMVAGEVLFPHAPPPATLRDFVGLLFFPFGVCVGIILGWRWEALGGSIAVGSVLVFYGAMCAMDGRFPRGPYFALLAAPGVLFLVSWAMGAVSSRSGPG